MRRAAWCVGLQHRRRGEKFAELLEEADVAARAGDVFVLYTDGITEAMNADERLFGEERLGALDRGARRSRRPTSCASGSCARSRPSSARADQHDDMTHDPDEGRRRPAAAGAAWRRHDRPGRRLPHAVGRSRRNVVRGLLETHGIAALRAQRTTRGRSFPLVAERRRRDRASRCRRRRRRGARIIESHRDERRRRPRRAGFGDELRRRSRRASATASAIAACSSTR